MTEPHVVGVKPWFPGAPGRWKWLNDLVPAERAAALRIVTALVVLIDIVFTMLPHFSVLFSPDELGGRDLYAWRFRDGHFYWSVLRWLPDAWGPHAVMGVWLASTLALLVGWRPLVSGLVCWACAVSFMNIHLGINNGGDRVRTTLLLTVAFSCSGAVWGVSAVKTTRPVFVHAWPLRVLFVQMAVLYFFSGFYKFLSPAWQSGYVMYFVNHDLAWCLTPAYTSLVPVWVHQLSAWVTLVWELGFPLLAVMKGTRTATLCLGVFFHLGTFITLEVGHFALYGIACYAMFVPWERLRRRIST